VTWSWAKVLDWVADPRERLDYTYQRQVALLTNLQRGAARADAERLGVARARLEVRVEVSRVRLETRETADEADNALGRLDDVWSRLSARTGEPGTRRQLLTQLRSGIADLDACRGRLDRQVGTLRRLEAELEGQASQALEGGREDLASEAVARQAGIGCLLSDLAAQRDSWQAEADRFTASYDGADPGGVAGE
jgi:phage shock protein A